MPDKKIVISTSGLIKAFGIYYIVRKINRIERYVRKSAEYNRTTSVIIDDYLKATVSIVDESGFTEAMNAYDAQFINESPNN